MIDTATNSAIRVPRPGALVAAAALALVDTPFRLHGRSRETGLDCVGLCIAALRDAGHGMPEPPSYALRGFRAERVARVIEAGGLVAVAEAGAGEGDIILARSGPMQLHLMIATRAGLVHAHAGLGRAVHMPGPAPWPVIGRWALAPSGEV